jgi:hypothetical protein
MPPMSGYNRDSSSQLHQLHHFHQYPDSGMLNHSLWPRHLHRSSHVIKHPLLVSTPTFRPYPDTSSNEQSSSRRINFIILQYSDTEILYHPPAATTLSLRQIIIIVNFIIPLM